MPPVIQLPTEIKELLGVSKVLKNFSGGQKYVFICSCGSVTQVVKMFKFKFSERDKRELDFYKANTAIEGIPRIIDVLDVNEETVVVEEYIEGVVLNEIKDKYVGNSKMTKKLCLDMFVRMKPIWEKKIIHRDLKPENIILHKDGSPYIIDFGIYKNQNEPTITTTGFQPHTLIYAAPEQIFGDKDSISYRTDFFSIGVLIYELKYGRLPFGNNGEDIIKNFKKGSLTYPLDANCPLKNFFDLVFQLNVSSRPGKVEIVLEALKS